MTCRYSLLDKPAVPPVREAGLLDPPYMLGEMWVSSYTRVGVSRSMAHLWAYWQLVPVFRPSLSICA